MFELPRFTPIEDNTGSLLLKAAEQAREQQQLFTNLIQKNEQIRQESFGGLQKQILDIASAKNLPVEVQRQILKDGMQQLTSLFKDRQNVKSVDLATKATDILVNAKTTSSAYQNYMENGEKSISDLKQQGWDEVNLRTALANSIYEDKEVETPMGPTVVRVPKAPESIGDPLSYLSTEIDNNPHKYLDRAKSDKDLTSMIGTLKPAELKITSSKDLTGTKTIRTAYTLEQYPFTRTEEVDQDGQKVKVNVLDTVPDQNIKEKLGVEKMVLSPNAFGYFANHPNPIIRAEVFSRGRDYIDAYNRKLGLNPQALTPENIESVMAQNPNVINPFDEQNKIIFSNLALTEKLSPQFGRFGDVSVTIDQAKPAVVRVSGGGGGSSASDDMYDRRGNIRPEYRFPTAWSQAIYGDAEVMKAVGSATFTVDGKTVTGKRVGDSLPSQIVKDNGKKATLVKVPSDPDTVYLVELDDDGNITDNVTKMNTTEAETYGAKISANYGSNVKTYNRLLPKARETVIQMTPNERALADKDAQAAASKQAEKEAGESLLVNLSTLSRIKRGGSQTFSTPARLIVNGKERSIVSIERADPGYFTDAKVKVVYKDKSSSTFANMDALIEDLKKSNNY